MKMKTIGTILGLLLLILGPSYAGQRASIDLSRDNPITLIGTKSKDYLILGFRLGLTHEEVWNILDKNNFYLGEKDFANSSKIYVYSRNEDGSKGKSVLYLRWADNEREMNSIVVYEGISESLSQNFRRLFTFEVLDGDSSFKKNFIGREDQSEVTLDIPSINSKMTEYSYDEIGLVIHHSQSSRGEEVFFEIVRPRP
jgi:hypothetical protein